MRILLTLLLTLMAPGAVLAQSQYSAVISVDAAAVTRYEITQRARFLAFIRAPGAGQALAQEQLIEDRLKIAAAQRAGIALTDAQLTQEMTSFAARANLTLPQFLSTLRSAGVDASTLRDFVRSGVLWREVVRARFNQRAQISDAEVDRALAQTNSASAARVLLNEIILPARPNLPDEVRRSQREAERLSRLRSISAFQGEASRLSVSGSRQRAGRLDWINLRDLPAALRPLLLSLEPGEVTQPLRLDNAIALFQMRAIEELAASTPTPAAIDYAALYVPAGTNVDRIVERLDRCDDLYGAARDMPRDALERGSVPFGDIPDDIAIELAKLDTSEVSTALTRDGGQTRVLLMLCARLPGLNASENRQAVRNQLRQARLEGLADSYLAELRAQAVVTFQ
ncbi:MAG: peptidylprolyl isomerase [Pseudomonadota bacterium]